MSARLSIAAAFAGRQSDIRRTGGVRRRRIALPGKSWRRRRRKYSRRRAPSERAAGRSAPPASFLRSRATSVSIERSKYRPFPPSERAEQGVARQRLTRLADEGQQEIELGRGQVDPPAAGTDKVARGLLEPPSREEIEPLDRHDGRARPISAVALAVTGFQTAAPFLIGVVQNEYPHQLAPISIAAARAGESPDRDES